MTTKSVPVPAAPAPVEDTPPWEENEVTAPVLQAGNEAVTVAWTQVAIPIQVFDDESGEPVDAHALWNITFRGIDPMDLIEQLTGFSTVAASGGVVFVTDKTWQPFAVGQRFVPQSYSQVVSSPLPPAVGAPQAKQPWKPGGQAAAPAQQQAPAQQHDAGDNTFLADALLVDNKINTTTKEPYVSLRMVGRRYPTFGVRVYADKLDAVLPGWSAAPPGEHKFIDENGVPFQVKCTFSWDPKPGKDGKPQPKNVYALELV